jgi:UDPglucose--hexose-1-phosphate uridylyltransferase
MSGEIRQNKVTKEWVIFAPSRGKRPKDFQQKEVKVAAPPYDDKCPFCPGNEDRLPDILMEMPNRESGRWQTRVVPNKFPALTPDGDITRSRQGIYVVMQGYGHHEVVIEAPRHNQQMIDIELEALGTIIETYHRRYMDLQKEDQNVMILIFRNHGLRAGASLIHPHSQIITTGMVPRHIRWREEEALRYFDEWGCCVYCDILQFELRDGRRVVLENDSFAAFVPFAADAPFETWIMPKRHQADFGRISHQEKLDLTSALHDILRRLYNKLNDPDYNYIINSSARKTGDPELHWYLRIRPRLVTRAGFEIGSGMRINPSMPENDAAFLNEDGTKWH